MRRLLALAAVLLLARPAVAASTHQFYSYNGPAAQLPTCVIDGLHYTIVDAPTPLDCTTAGGGTSRSECVCAGGTWGTSGSASGAFVRHYPTSTEYVDSTHAVTGPTTITPIFRVDNTSASHAAHGLVMSLDGADHFGTYLENSGANGGTGCWKTHLEFARASTAPGWADQVTDLDPFVFHFEDFGCPGAPARGIATWQAQGGTELDVGATGGGDLWIYTDTDVRSATRGDMHLLANGKSVFVEDNTTLDFDSANGAKLRLPRLADCSGVTGVEGAICWDSDDDLLYIGGSTNVFHPGNHAGAVTDGGAATTAAALSAGADVPLATVTVTGSGTASRCARFDASHHLVEHTADCGGGGGGGTSALLDSTVHTDTTTGTVARGDLITGQGASPTWTRLAKGSANTILKSDGTDLSWGSLPGAALPAFAGGDVTSGVGSVVLSLVNIPTATPLAGSLLATNIVAPGMPAAGKTSIYVDSTDKRLHDKNDAGAIGTTVVADTGAANNFLTAISAAGAVSKARPTCGNLSDSAGGCTMSTTAGGDLAGTFPSPTVTATHLSAALPINQGGTGTTSTLTGLVRGSGAAMTAAELSGDVTTSGSNATTIAPNAVTDAKASDDLTIASTHDLATSGKVQIGSLTAGSAACVALDATTDRLYLDANCNGTQDSGETYLDGRTAEVSIALTADGAAFTQTVTGQTWVSAATTIVCQPFATSADGQTVETYYAAQFSATASTIVAGTGFTVGVYSPNGASGTFRFECYDTNGGGGSPSGEYSAQRYPGSSTLNATASDEFISANNGNWSWGNQGTTTLTDEIGSEYLSFPADATANLRCRWVAAPASGDYVATVYLTPRVPNNATTTGPSVMLSFLDTGSIATPTLIRNIKLFWRGTNTTAVAYDERTSYTAASTNATVVEIGQAARLQPVCLQARFTNSTKSMVFAFAPDCATWETVATKTFTNVPADLAVCGSAEASSLASQVREWWMRVRTDATGIASPYPTGS
jgi:hypothetical protein